MSELPDRSYPADPELSRYGQQQDIIRQASRKYQRAAQVAADAALAMYRRLNVQSGLINDHQVQLVVSALPTITEAILADQDILEPEGEE